MQFEYLSMEVMQCGLSFGLVLRKRDILRQCFDNFDFDKIAAYTDADVARIMDTDGMIRAERKIRAIISNAACFQKIRAEHGTFSDYLWGYTDNKTVLYKGRESGVPVQGREGSVGEEVILLTKRLRSESSTTC